MTIPVLKKIFSKILKEQTKNPIIPIFKNNEYTMYQQYTGKDWVFKWSKLHKKVLKQQKTQFF